MTHLALHLSRFVNGVAMRLRDVSQGMFPSFPVNSITNGVHCVTWTHPAFRDLYDPFVAECPPTRILGFSNTIGKQDEQVPTTELPVVLDVDPVVGLSRIRDQLVGLDLNLAACRVDEAIEAIEDKCRVAFRRGHGDAAAVPLGRPRGILRGGARRGARVVLHADPHQPDPAREPATTHGRSDRTPKSPPQSAAP